MSKRKVRLLYLDDEINNLNSFKATFRRDYTVFTAVNVEEAMAILEKEELEVIITDQRMPDMTGVEFLESIIDKYPEPIRMLLTGYTDIGSVIDAINKGQVYRYITKPWNEEELRISIDNAYQYYITRRELEEKNQELSKANEELDRFVYSASHDLRAPLTSILGVVNLAKMELGEGSHSEYFGMIEDSVHKLDEFVKNIINYSKNARLELESSTIDFKTLIEDTYNELSKDQEGKNISFDVSVEQDDVFLSDVNKINILLNNFLSNSIKYIDVEKEEAKIEVIVVVRRNTAKIKIIDNGVGIEEKHLDKVFNMFYRATQLSEGSGIGLYIAKEVLNKLKGTVKISSEPKEGTSVTIKIPGV